MDDFKSLCCICMRNIKGLTLSTLRQFDTNNIKYIKKLIFCVPSETWKPRYQICGLCISQLDVAYKFLHRCIESEKFRLKDLEQLEKQKDKIRGTNIDLCRFTRFETKEETFSCGDCGKSFQQKKYLRQHITKLHINKKRRGDNKKVIKTEENAPENLENEKDINCNSPNSITFVKEDVTIDEDNKENTKKLLGEEKFKTEDVKSDQSDIEDIKNDNIHYSYSEKSEVEDDLDEKISDKKTSSKKEPQKCTFCDEVFKKRQDWVIHVRTQHSLEKPFACDECDARYMNSYSLLIHTRKHKNEKPFICATCGKSFVSSADLNHHTKIHNTDRAYPCPMCDRSFKTHSNLRTHRLQMHLDPAEWKFPCNLCDKKFPIRGNLIKHLKRHAGIKEFDCHICEKKFVNKAELSLHLNTHTNQRLFKCSICEKDYKNREGLRRHMKVVHDQGNWKAPKMEKKYPCPMCPKIFSFGNKLQRHIFTHTGEKPFKCDYCQKKFIDNYGRKMHYKKDHNIEYFG